MESYVFPVLNAWKLCSDFLFWMWLWVSWALTLLISSWCIAQFQLHTRKPYQYPNTIPVLYYGYNGSNRQFIKSRLSYSYHTHTHTHTQRKKFLSFIFLSQCACLQNMKWTTLPYPDMWLGNFHTKHVLGDLHNVFV